MTSIAPHDEGTSYCTGLPLHDHDIGETRACPDCGKPQHYTGIELGWVHDALVDTWDCADPRKASALRPGEFCGCPGDTHLPTCPAKTGALTERARQIVADPFAAAFDGVEEAEF